MKFHTIALAIAVCLQGGMAPQDPASRPAASDEPVLSGPQKGEPVPAIQVIDVNGGRKERIYDPRREVGDDLAIYFLFTGPARPISRSIGKIDALVREANIRNQRTNKKELKIFFVGLMPDRLEGDRRLRDVWMMLKPDAPANVSVEGVEGPGAWGINKKCSLTVVFGKGGKVVFNHATTSPGDKDDDVIRGALSEALGYEVTSRPAWADTMGGGMMGGGMMGGGMKSADPTDRDPAMSMEAGEKPKKKPAPESLPAKPVRPEKP
jgi:hypothetical protein